MKPLIAVISIFFLCSLAQGQPRYRVEFTDKLNNDFSLERPTEFLSSRSIERRVKQGIELEEGDLPLSKSYVQSIKSIASVELLATSKWFNDVVIQVNDTSVLKKIRDLTFVKSVWRFPGNWAKKGEAVVEKLDTTYTDVISSDWNSEYGSAFRQTDMINVNFLHDRSFRGAGMRIAVIDAGFSEADESLHLNHLYTDGRVVDTRDFVQGDANVYGHSVHGYFVLTTMAADTPGMMIGTAPEAEYVLLRSEDASNEYLLEEYYWTEAAEFADSAGCDIINTSLGYSLFDDTLQDHTLADMDGKTTRITLSSELAASRGMLLVNSAGNAGSSSWGKITAPADAENILSIAAVDSAGALAFFSSRGPTSDGRIKPDLAAMGQGVFIGFKEGDVGISNGTSFSSPIIAGAAACLWQANPTNSWKEIMQSMRESGDRYKDPDTNIGYGLPDFLLADQLLKGGSRAASTGNASVKIYPNPFSNELMVLMNVSRDQRLSYVIYDLSGRKMVDKSVTLRAGKRAYLYLSNELGKLASGMYVMKLSSSEIEGEYRIIRE